MFKKKQCLVESLLPYLLTHFWGYLDLRFLLHRSTGDPEAPAFIRLSVARIDRADRARGGVCAVLLVTVTDTAVLGL